MKLLDTNDVDGKVDEGIKEFDKDLHDTDVFVFAVPEHTAHYSAVFKNAMDWLVVKSNMNNNLGSTYGFSYKPIVLITFTPSKKSGGRHFDMTKNLLEKMGGSVVKTFLKNDCWDNLYKDNIGFIRNECEYIDTFKENRVTIEKQEPKQWKSKDERVTSYNRWLEKWK
jgi:multimeric flavodoxin WrbA